MIVGLLVVCDGISLVPGCFLCFFGALVGLAPGQRPSQGCGAQRERPRARPFEIFCDLEAVWRRDLLYSVKVNVAIRFQLIT